MGEETGISWTDATWNPTRGCSRVSEGCRNCYAEVQAARIVRMSKGKPTAYDDLVRVTAGGEPRWTGKVTLSPDALALPLGWRKPRRIFVNSMSDLFHEELTNEQVAAVFGVMAACPQHTFQVLTKRARRMREWFEWRAGGMKADNDIAVQCVNILDDEYPDVLGERVALGLQWPLPNVWIGVSVENQAAADERIPELLATPAAVRFLSCEPLLGPVDLEQVRAKIGPTSFKTGSCLEGNDGFGLSAPRNRVDWVIAGCESGPGARPCDVAWLRALRDQCADAGVAFFLKQARVTEPVEGVTFHRISPDGPVTHTTQFSRASVAAGEGSHHKPGGVIELPYLDGVQHAAFPIAAALPIPSASFEVVEGVVTEVNRG